MASPLQTDFLGITLPSPLVLPAGILGMSAGSLEFALKHGYGLVTTKSLTLEPRPGHEGPVVVEYGAGILNSMGLCNPGIIEGLKEVNLFVGLTAAPILVSLFATDIRDFIELVHRTNDSAATLIELNLSCPNVMDEYGIPLASSKDMVASIVEGVKRISQRPVLAKLSPNAADVPSIAEAAERSGADGLTLINTLGPGLSIDPYARKPILHPTYGGVSGPAIKPIALKIVYDCAQRVQIPIIGMGGISSGLDAVEMLLAGANLVGVGSAICKDGIGVILKIQKEISSYLQTQGFASVGAVPKLSKRGEITTPEAQKDSGALVTEARSQGHTFAGRITLPIQRVRNDGPSAKTIFLAVDLPRIQPGQFFMVTDYQGGEKPISVSAVQASEKGKVCIGLTVKAAGPFTQRFQDKKLGDMVSIRGPYGNPFTLHRGKVLLVGGGCGAAPLLYLTQALIQNGAEVTLINGARKMEELLLTELFAELPIRYLVTLEEPEGRTAVDAARELLKQESFSFAYASGPERMMAGLKPLFQSMEYEFLMERYMKCGIGICGSCTCDPAGFRLCVEGPVIAKSVVETLTDFGLYKRDASGQKINIRTEISSCVRDTP